MIGTNLTVRLDTCDKDAFSTICERIGLSASAAINVFVKAVIREQKIPFELSAKNDSFQSKENIEYLERIKKLDEDGKLSFIEKSIEELDAMEKN